MTAPTTARPLLSAPSGVPHRVLITGGSGFIGSHFCAVFDTAGQPYSILDLCEPVPAAKPTRFIQGDVRDPHAIDNALDDCDVVLHLAAAHHDSGIADATYFDVNVGSTDLIVRGMVRRGLRRICFFSSAAVYGSGESARDESFQPAPASPYGASKWEAEKVLESATHRGDIDAMIVRPSVTFGPNNFANMYSLIRQLDAGLYLQVGDGKNVKSLSYVENLVEFTLWAWSRQYAGYDVFNWVESPDFSSEGIARALASALGRRVPSFRLPLSLALTLALPIELAGAALGREVPITRARVRKLAKERTQFSAAKARSTGFSPSVSLLEGIQRTVAWYLAVGRSAPRVRRIPPGQPLLARTGAS